MALTSLSNVCVLRARLGKRSVNELFCQFSEQVHFGEIIVFYSSVAVTFFAPHFTAAAAASCVHFEKREAKETNCGTKRRLFGKTCWLVGFSLCPLLQIFFDTLHSGHCRRMNEQRKHCFLFEPFKYLIQLSFLPLL